MPVELALQPRRRQPESMTRILRNGPRRRGFTAHEKRYAHGALVSHYRDLRTRAVFEPMEERHHRVRGEIDMPHPMARLAQHCTLRYRNEPEMGKDAAPRV